MKIAVDGRYIQDYFPGIARYTYHLAENLARLVEEELYLLHNPALGNSRYDLGQLEKSGRVRLLQVSERTFSFSEQLTVPLLLARQGIQLFHSPYYLKPYLTTSRSVVSIHDVIMKLFPEDTPSRKARLLFDLAVRLSLRSARRVVTGSQFSKETLVKYYGATPERINVVYYGVDGRFHPRSNAQIAPIRQRLSLPAKFALYVGINKPHKNLVRLVEAFARARESVDIDLVVAGKEDRRYPQARVAAEKLGIAGHVVFLGDVAEADLPALYNLAEAFVFPSLCEGFGLPVLEAMASGVPVACSRASSLPEVAGDSAVLFDPMNVDEMAEAIARVAGDGGTRAGLVERGLGRASQFTWEETAKQTLAIYREALA